MRAVELEENYAKIDLQATFIHMKEQIKVAGFYSDSGVYKVRFLP